MGLAVDSFGGVYISEYDGYVIRYIDTNSIISTYAGYGTSAYVDNVPRHMACFYHSIELSLGRGGLYVADWGNGVIRNFSPGIPYVAPIVGPTSGIPVYLSTSFTDATPGGTWASGNPSVLTINPTTGTATAISAGYDSVSYTVNFGCDTIVKYKPFTVLSTISLGANYASGAVLSIYPNPVTNALHIDGCSQGTAVVRNVLGNVVITTSLCGNTVIDTSPLPPGVYTMRLNDTIVRFVKQ
jgi:hypothetical protein